jgi:prolipoprotein diacylglyceryltransferase
MESYFVINPDHPGNYYALFYLLAFLTGFIVLMREGHNRKFPVVPWMMVIATGFLFFIVGCRLIVFHEAEWKQVFQFEPIPYSTGRSVLGGILLSILGIILAKKYLRFQYTVLDAFAIVLPLALAIQRFGCLIAGCCYGTTTPLSWGILYGNNSHAFYQHAHEGLLAPNAVTALPVHPVQLYEVVCCITIIILLIKLRPTIKAAGNFFLVSVGLYGVFRFLLEFVRESRGSEQFFYLNYAQWCILLILPILFLFIIRREKKLHENTPTIPVRHEFLRSSGYLLLLLTLFLFVSRWLDRLEVASFNIVLLPLLAILTWHLYTWVTVPRYRLATVLLPVLALVLMSQTTQHIAKSDSTRISYNTISLGLMGGSADMIYGEDYSDDCFDEGERTAYSNEYSAFALGYSHTQQRGESSTTFGVNWFKGKHNQSSASSTIVDFKETSYHLSTFAFSPYVHFNRPKIGFGIGLHAGEFSRIVPVENGDPSTLKKYNFYPSFRFRVGKLSTVYFDYRFADQFPTALPVLSHQFALGIGFTKRGEYRGGGIRIGTASNAGFFTSVAFGLGDGVILEGYYGGAGGILNPYDYTHAATGAISMHVKFGK